MIAYGHLLDGLVRGGDRDAAGRPLPHAGRRAARRRLPPRRARRRARPVRRPGPADRVRHRLRGAAGGQPPDPDGGQPAARRRERLQQRRVPPGVRRRHQRSRQRPLGRQGAVGRLARRRGRRRPAAVGGDRRPDLRGAGRGPGPGADGAAQVGHRLPAAVADGAGRPGRPRLLVDRLGRLDRRQRPRPAGHHRLRDEQDGRRALHLAPRAPTPTCAPPTSAWRRWDERREGLHHRRRLLRHHHGEAAQGPRHRLRPVRDVRRRGRQLVLPQPQRPLGGLRVAAHRHLEDPAPVRGLPGAGRLAGLPEPPADARLLPRVRRRVRPPRRDRVRHRRRAGRPQRRPAAGTSRCRPARPGPTPTWSSPTATTGSRGSPTTPGRSTAC